ncbi:MAG: hypothetical protein P8Y02_14045, partial [Deinococcales bacterium]
MNLHGARVAHHQGRVPHRGDGLPNLLYVQPFALYDELHIVPVAFFPLCVQILQVHGRRQVV